MIQIRSLFSLLSESPNETLSSSKVILLESESTSEIYSEIKQKAGADKIFRLSVFLTHKDQLIFSAPAGPDMNDGIGDLMFCAKEGFFIIEKLGIKPFVGIISGGRAGDIGRNEKCDQTIRDAEILEKMLAEENIPAKHYTILIEDAVKEANFLILPDSLSGEMVLKTAAGIGEGREIGNILLLQNADGSAFLEIYYIEQLTKNAVREDAESLKEALERCR